MLRPTRVRTHRLPSFPCTALVVLLAACSPPRPTTVLEPVVRLTEHGTTLPQSNVPVRCAIGDEFRPAFGCPPFLLLGATASPGKKSPRRIVIEAAVPSHAHGKELVAIPSVRLGVSYLPERLPARVIPEAPSTLAFNVKYDSTKLTEHSRVQVLAHVLEPTRRTFSTRHVPIPPDAELSVGLAIAGFAEEAGAGPTEFTITAAWEGGQKELLRETLPAREGGRWHDRRVDLSDLGDREVTFTFTSITTGSGEIPESSVAFPVWGAPQILASRPRGERRNVVLISLDTVRADFLGAEYNGTPISPWFDRLSEDGARFTQAVSTYPSTSASHMSLFTALYPARHKVRFATHHLDQGIKTLPQLLAKAGYETAAVTENAMILAGSGFARGFDSYREHKGSLKVTGSVDKTFADGVAWLERHPGELFFLFLHTYEAHSPYAPKPEALAAIPATDTSKLDKHDARWEETRRAYAAEVHYTDGALRRLFSELERLDVLEDTLVVVTADHGDEFGEHGRLGHAKSVYDEVLRVPLLFWDPGNVPAGRVVEEQVSLVDVTPTILDLVGLAPPSRVPGRSLVPVLAGGPLEGNEVRFAEGNHKGVRMVTARTSTTKWIWLDDGSEMQAFDLTKDPGEQAPLAYPELLAEGQAFIDAYLAQDFEEGGSEASDAREGEDGAPQQEERVLDEATRQKLEALGYLE